MCRYAFTLVLVLLVGLLLGAVACCYFVATVCPTSPLLLDGYVDQGGKAD